MNKVYMLAWCILCLGVHANHGKSNRLSCDKTTPVSVSKDRTCREAALFKYSDITTQQKFLLNSIDSEYIELNGIKDAEGDYFNEGRLCDMRRTAEIRKIEHNKHNKHGMPCNDVNRMKSIQRDNKDLYERFPCYDGNRDSLYNHAFYGCPIERVCRRFTNPTSFDPIRNFDILERPGPDGLQSYMLGLEPKCSANQYIIDNNRIQNPFKDPFEIISPPVVNNNPFACEGEITLEKQYLHFFSGYKVRYDKANINNIVEPNIGINRVDFKCSSVNSPQKTITFRVGSYPGSYEVPSGNFKPCPEGQRIIGIFQFTVDRSDTNGFFIDKHKGLVDLGIFCGKIRCPGTYTRDANGNCARPICTCDNGEANIPSFDDVHEDACKNGQERCQKCNAGYRLSGHICKLVDAICELTDPVTNSVVEIGSRVQSCAKTDNTNDFCLVDNETPEHLSFNNSRGQRAIFPSSAGLACEDCYDGFEIDDQFNDKFRVCKDIDECDESRKPILNDCSLTSRTCFNTVGSYSCNVVCNTERSVVRYEENTNNTYCECSEGYYRDSADLFNRVSGFDPFRFCVTCTDSFGKEKKDCSGHGSCVQVQDKQPPRCICDDDYQGAACEFTSTYTFTCTSSLTFVCRVMDFKHDSVERDPTLFYRNVWECQNENAFSLRDPFSRTSLEFKSVWVDHISIFDQENTQLKEDRFFCHEMHDILIGRPPSIERTLALERTVSWENSNLWEEEPPFLDTHPHLEPPFSLCPFPYNTDIYREPSNSSYVFAPCEVPSVESEANGWFFEAIIPNTSSSVSCFLLDVTARASRASSENLVYRCKGYITKETEPKVPYLALDCLLSSPLAPEEITTQSNAGDRGYWILNQCFSN